MILSGRKCFIPVRFQLSEGGNSVRLALKCFYTKPAHPHLAYGHKPKTGAMGGEGGVQA